MQYFIKLFAIFIFFALAVCNVKSQVISTIAGGSGDGDSAFSIGIYSENNIAIDSGNNIYIPIPERHFVLKLSPGGIYSKAAGTGIGGSNGNNGSAVSAQLQTPYSVATDGQGNLYIADSYSHLIRKVSPKGIISIFAGNGIQGFSGDNGPATSAQLNGANVVAADRLGNIYISDFINNRVRKIDTNGLITTIAGDGSYAGSGGDGMPATSVGLGYVIGIKVDPVGNVFISELSARVRKIDVNGIMHSIVDGGVGFYGDGGQARFAAIGSQQGCIGVDAAGNIYIADAANNRVRKIDSLGIIRTIAGDGTNLNDGDEGLATNAKIASPSSIVTDAAGNIYIVCKYTIRKITPDGIIHRIAGNGTEAFNGEGNNALKTQLNRPGCVIADKSGNIFIADSRNYRIIKIDTLGIVRPIAGTGVPGYNGDNIQATAAQLGYFYSFAFDKTNNLYIADAGNNRIRKIDNNGIITTVAGNGIGSFGGDNGPAINANLNYPFSVVADSAGNIFISDRNNGRIRKVDTGGIITTIAGTDTAGFSGDNGPAINARLSTNVCHLAIDKKTNILIADQGNRRIRKIDKNGIITTVAGNGTDDSTGTGGLATSVGIDAYFVSIDSSNNFYTDNIYDRILKVDTSGTITIVGGGGNSYDDGILAKDAILRSEYLSVDNKGNMLVSISSNHIIRKITNYNTTYKFIGNGNASNALNWYNGLVPPSVLPSGSLIIIDPSPNGACVVDIPLTVSKGAFLVIQPGSKIQIQGGLFIQQ